MSDRRFSTYVPMDRRVALAASASLPEACRGAALFADIAGFTTLSSTLTAELGPRRGVDTLSGVLEEVYERVISEIHRGCGSVIGFSGDAVTCWFDDDPVGVGVGVDDDPVGVGVASGAERAVAVGLALHAAIAVVPPVAGRAGAARLGLKVAVACGPARRGLVGDPQHQLIEVLCGTTVERMALLEQWAVLGEVAVDDEVRAALGPRARLGRTGRIGDRQATVVESFAGPPLAGWPGTADAVPDEALRAWAARPVRELDRAAPTELRPTAALFVAFQPLDVDGDEGALARLDASVRWIQATVAETDGTLIQLTVGDKSGYAYITHGAPRAHEDMAARAARAALTLVAPPPHLEEMGPLRLGLAMGTSRVGRYGAPAHGTYGVLGDGVNLAARLMTAADPGTVLATRAVADAAGPSFLTDPHAPVRAKGFSGAIDVVALRDRVGFVTTLPAHRRALVGRDDEVGWLLARLATATGGEGRALVVRGAPGVGKSHLVAAVRRRLEEESDVTWLECQGDELAPDALGPFVRLLKDLTFQALARDSVHRRALFDAVVDDLAGVTGGAGAALGEERSFLGALIDVHWPDSPFERHDPTARFERCLRSYELFLRAECRRRPVVLHVVDADWLDEDSRRLLTVLVRAVADVPMAILVSERTATTSVADVLELDPLDASCVAALVRETLGAQPDPDVVEVLVQRSHGNPLFAEQLTLSLAGQGALRRRDDGGWSWASAGRPHELPVSLNTLLVARLDQLPASARDVVMAAAVLGSEVDLPLLRAMVGDAGAVDGATRSATAAGIWIDEGRPDAVSFSHSLLADAAYEMQPERALQVWHGRASTAIGAVHGAGARDGERAHHDERAGDWPGALHHLLLAARRARRLPAWREARGYLARAVAAARRAAVADEELATIILEGCEAAVALGEYGEAVTELDAIGSLAVPARVAVQRFGLAGVANRRWGRADAAEAAYDAAIVALQAAPDAAAAGDLYGGLAMVLCDRDDLDAAGEVAQLSLDLAVTAGDVQSLATAEHRLAIVRWRGGDGAGAKALALRSAAGFSAVGSLDGEAAAVNTLGLIAMAEGDLDEAVARLGDAVTRFEASGNRPALARALGNQGDALARRGDGDAARRCVEASVAILAEIGLDAQDVHAAMWQPGTW